MPKFEKVTCRILNRQSRSPAWSGPCSARWPVWTPWCGRAAAPRLSPRGSLSPYTCHHFRGEFILKNWTTNLTDWLKPSIFGGTPRRLINGHPAKKINGSECDFSFKQKVFKISYYWIRDATLARSVFRIVFGTWIVKMLCCELIKVYLALSGNRSKCIITNSDFYAGSTNAASTNVAEPVTFAKAQAG